MQRIDLNPPSQRVAIVTGGANGIGKAIAEALASDGYQVVVSDLDDSAGNAVADEVGGCFVHCDLRRKADCEELVLRTRQLCGPISILINNAGIQHIAPIETFPDDKWEEMIRTMLVAPFHLTKAVWRDMRVQGWGRIVNMGSIHSTVASANKSAYVVAKHGLLGLTRTAALEGGPVGITVNAVCPAYVSTELVKRQVESLAAELNIGQDQVESEICFRNAVTKRFIQPGEVAGLVRYLCSAQAGAITGASIAIDLGWTAQ